MNNTANFLLQLALSLGFANCAFAEDAEIKLNSNDGSTRLVVQNNNAVTVFSADSAGNIVISGAMPVAGAGFSVGGSTFVVKGGNVGIGTANPGAALEVAGQVKINGGTPGAGKVLRSDAVGLASWKVAASTFSIGDNYGGGKIFWVDAAGKQVLIAPTADQSASVKWSNNSNGTGATLDGVYAGKANTVMISTMQHTGSYAAQVCADYSVTINGEYYDDWYLPSKYELSLLYPQKDAIGGFAASIYWSSTETGAFAWAVNFINGGMSGDNKTIAYYVRCVRSGP